MTYVVTEACIRCKYMDCVEVCPVDCFYEGENMLVINPDECIDCGVCEPECPVEAILPDTEDEAEPEVLAATDLIDAERLAERHEDRERLTTAQRAAGDRTWAFGHIIVDEAQELSPMAWRLLMRRCPSRSASISARSSGRSAAKRVTRKRAPVAKPV